ncbi:MAG: AbrB/MazE/SpoVT family DNA-binding domain-containing protein [Microbacterium sp.]|nr:MAG: AbrB/MazE/SpoVT family DNA-binding domain-containing protein [Microbacterium sp.]
MTIATATTKGQITIPQDIRERLGIVPGTRVDFVPTPDGRVWLRPVTGSVSDLFGTARYDGSPLTIEEMNEGIRDAAAGIGRE